VLQMILSNVPAVTQVLVGPTIRDMSKRKKQTEKNPPTQEVIRGFR